MKPSNGWIKRLGDMLDEAEAACSKGEITRHVLYAFKLDYIEAVTARDLHQREVFEKDKRTPTIHQCRAYRQACVDAEFVYDELDDLGSDFVTTREMIEANAALAQAIAFLDIARVHKGGFYNLNPARRQELASLGIARGKAVHHGRHPSVPELNALHDEACLALIRGDADADALTEFWSKARLQWDTRTALQAKSRKRDITDRASNIVRRTNRKSTRHHK